MSVRLPSAAHYVAQVDKEHRFLPRLAPHLPLPIPAPIARGAPGEGYPWPWSVYRWIEGEPASRGRIDDAIAFARDLAAFLLALERVDTADAPPPGTHNFHRGGSLAVYDSETQAALAALRGRIDTEGAAALWTEALGSRWRHAPVWVHGDVASGNLLVAEGRLSAVIDFGGMAAGDPASDLVIAWTMFSGESRAAFLAALPLDADTWTRARGWALWKALKTAAGHDGNQREAAGAWRTIEAVLAEPQRHPS
jgi:aminoglycoside phosphotransferase (APT) family kinase protein